MKSIIVYREHNNIIGGLYTDISYNLAASEVGKNNILYYIPLVITGRCYQDRKEDIRNKAIEYQNTYYDFCDYSYGELSIINEFFEKAGRRYGLLNEFTTNGII
jgi:hypothetical protein